MNDFTKDELEMLVYALDGVADRPCLALENKIQSLIDNYCNCTQIKTMKDIDGSEIVDFCVNCGRQVE